MGLPIAICSSNAPQRTPIPSPSFPPPGWGPWEMVTAMSSTPIAAEPRSQLPLLCQSRGLGVDRGGGGSGGAGSGTRVHGLEVSPNGLSAL